MSDQHEQSQPKWRPRFSLLTVLLLTTIVAMAITITLLWREVSPLRADNRRLRNEVGELSIDDPTLIYAVEVRTHDEFLWKWRVWVPSGQKAVVHFKLGDVPRTGFPVSDLRIVSDSGEQWVTLAVGPDHDTKSWEAPRLESPAGYVGSSGIRDQDRWWEWRSSVTSGEGVGHTSQAMKAAESGFVLRRLRGAPESSSDILQTDEPAPGLYHLARAAVE